MPCATVQYAYYPHLYSQRVTCSMKKSSWLYTISQPSGDHIRISYAWYRQLGTVDSFMHGQRLVFFILNFLHDYTWGMCTTTWKSHHCTHTYGIHNVQDTCMLIWRDTPPHTLAHVTCTLMRTNHKMTDQIRGHTHTHRRTHTTVVCACQRETIDKIVP